VNSLFIHPYLDEDVSVLLAVLLRSRGFEVTTTVEAGQRGANDPQQLEYAILHGMTMVTHNRADFEELTRQYIAAGKSHAGIIIAVRRPAHDIARRLLALMDQVSAEEMVDQLRYI
jgi:hypothetical protein